MQFYFFSLRVFERITHRPEGPNNQTGLVRIRLLLPALLYNPP